MLYKPTILVTGFDPFNRCQSNTSLVVVEHLRQHSPQSVVLHTKVLPTSFVRSTKEMNATLAAISPDAVIAFGMLVGLSALNVERVALNIDDAYSDDNDGDKPMGRAIIPTGPVAYTSTLPTSVIVDRLRLDGIPAYISNHAGTYVCNHVFYTTLHYIAESHAKLAYGFIHLPCLPEEALRFTEPIPSMTLDLVVKGVECVLNMTIEFLSARAAEPKDR